MEYHLRYQHLRSRGARAGAGPEDHLAFARWLVASKAEAQPAYWRKLKAAALHGLNLEGDASARQAEALLRAEGSDGAARGAPRRASRRKAITADELQRLLETLTQRTRTSEVARVTILWLIAGYATGLRPCEWRSAALIADEDGRPVLQVVNAKHTNGRAHGATRTLALSALRPPEREAIALLLEAVAARPGEFARLHRASVDLLRAVNRELWPCRREFIGLYSARHQFAADAKRVLDRTEVAALLGHKTTRTAGLHYASRRHGRPRPGLPQAQPDEMTRVVTHRHSGPPTNAAPTSVAVVAGSPDANGIT
jgi:integrase